MAKDLEENTNRLDNAFLRMSRLPLYEEKLMTDSERRLWEMERARDGAKVFKRRVLGLCGRSSVKSEEELSELLYNLNAIDDISEGREIVNLMVEESVKNISGIVYSYDLFGDSRGFHVESVKNLKSTQRYRVRV